MKSLDPQETFRIIKSTIEEYSKYQRLPFVRSGLIICDEEHFRGWKLSKEYLSAPCPMYLNIEKNSKLRGATGFIRTKEENLAEALIKAAKGAAFQDPRFSQVTPQELSELTFTLFLLDQTASSQLSKAQATSYLQNPTPLKDQAYLIQSGYRTCTILPEPVGTDPLCQETSVSKGTDPSLNEAAAPTGTAPLFQLKDAQISPTDEVTITSYPCKILKS